MGPIADAEGWIAPGEAHLFFPHWRGSLLPRQRTIFRCVPACEPPAPSSRLTDVKAPRHVSLRFAVSKPLDRFLPLMSCQGVGRPNFTPRAFARVRRSPVRARRPIPREPNTRFVGCSWTRLNAENATGSCL